jgi:asparagine synthase (glutamine-hydrolysing)
MDEPIADPAVLVTYLLNREARKAVTVLLSGVGGDELFAGYRKHQAHFLAERYRRLPAPLRRGVIEPLVAALPAFRGTRLKGHVRLAKKMARSGSLPPHERFLADSAYFTAPQKDLLYTPALRARVAGADPYMQHRARFARVADADFLNQMLYLDTTTFMVSLNLTYNDKMSMASSVEVRVPFVDWELAEWASRTVPPHLKLHGQTTKHLLRLAFGPWLPPEVLTQRKAGFGAPVDQWLAHELRPLVAEVLSESAVRARGLFEPAYVRRLIEEHQRGRQDWSAQLWQLLVWELWMRTFNVQT